ncbi:ABC transporter ATP-binding protein [Roseovarius nanhaiticus]|uniref:ABC transporter ATP-binding protein n=1 Tax=Roseovarius nanhaiticus TaxID=573024 RepID=UPI0024934D3A|nr:ABC transporter ATP-binding protein [Roseovarius nanhaiticus]
MTAPGLTLTGSVSVAGTPVVPHIALTVAPGSWTCLLGPSGIGKSTLLRVIAGIADEAELTGTLTISDGAPLRGRVALMSQSDLLLPWLSVTENVMLGARLRGDPAQPQRAIAMIERVGLSEHLEKKPGQLSGGQRQRAALARTLMEDRPLILLDEPFSALDARTRAQMQDLTAELLTGHTVLMVTHDPAEAARLGTAIEILSETGLTPWRVPPGAPPRPVDNADTLQAQGALLAALRGPGRDAS